MNRLWFGKDVEEKRCGLSEGNVLAYVCLEGLRDPLPRPQKYRLRIDGMSAEKRIFPGTK
jgi:hypothetical protein